MTLVIGLSEIGNTKRTIRILPSSDQYLHSKVELNNDRAAVQKIQQEQIKVY